MAGHNTTATDHDESTGHRNSWFHVVLTTYGSWLPGDNRGFRTRHHRLHVEGDYTHPPPSNAFGTLKRHSQQSLKHDSVSLNTDQRRMACRAIRDSLFESGATIACLAVAARHVHILVQLPPEETRKRIGTAKRHTWHVLNETGWTKKLWAKGGKFVPVNDEQHWSNVFRYIRRHEEEGACVWTWDGNEEDEEGSESSDAESDVGGIPPDAAGGL